MQDPKSTTNTNSDTETTASTDSTSHSEPDGFRTPTAGSAEGPEISAGEQNEYGDEEIAGEDFIDDEYGDEELTEEELAELAADEGLESDGSIETPQVAATRSPELYAASLANALAAARIADDLRGQDIVVLDLTAQTSIVDFFVIATGNSRRQMHAIADEVNRKLKREDGNRRFSIEGYRTEGNWILTDYGDVVLHVFTAEGRLLYNLEQLWADAKRIDWKQLTASQSPV